MASIPSIYLITHPTPIRRMIKLITILQVTSLTSFRGRRRRFIPISFHIFISRVSRSFVMTHYTELITTLAPVPTGIWRTQCFFCHKLNHSLQRSAHSSLFFCRCSSRYMERFPVFPSIFMDKMHSNDRNEHKKEPHDAKAPRGLHY